MGRPARSRPHGACFVELARDLFTDVEIDLDRGRFVNRLEEAWSAMASLAACSWIEISQREMFEKGLGFGRFGGQLDHQVQILREPRVTVICGCNASSEVESWSEVFENRHDSSHGFLQAFCLHGSGLSSDRATAAAHHPTDTSAGLSVA